MLFKIAFIEHVIWKEKGVHIFSLCGNSLSCLFFYPTDAFEFPDFSHISHAKNTTTSSTDVQGKDAYLDYSQSISVSIKGFPIASTGDEIKVISTDTSNIESSFSADVSNIFKQHEVFP